MAKVFQILVPDNTLVSRIISCENQVTELFVIDRADKHFVSDYSSDLTKPALYILINRDAKKLYVGETDDSFKRLKNHEAKDFWSEAIVFHSTTDTLSTTEVKWLEAKTYEALSNLVYYDLSENKQKPQLYAEVFPKDRKTVVPPKETNVAPFSDSDFLGRCASKLMKAVGQPLVKKGRSVYVTTDGKTGYVIRTSKMYPQGNREKYWYAYRRNKEVMDCEQQFFVYGCRDENTIIVLPVSEIEHQLECLNNTKDANDNPLYWHIVFLKDNDGKITWLISKPKVHEMEITDRLLGK